MRQLAEEYVSRRERELGEKVDPDRRPQEVQKVKAYIATRGPHGATIHEGGATHNVPPAHERRVTDPTGCGDAFRAGLIFGIEKGYDWMTIGRIGNLMGALKVEHPGTQNQRFDYDEFSEQFRQQFGYALA